MEDRAVSKSIGLGGGIAKGGCHRDFKGATRVASQEEEQSIGGNFLGSSVAPEDIMGIGGKDFGKHQNRIITSRDALARFGSQQFLVRVGRELFGEAKENMVRAVYRGEGAKVGVFLLLYSLEGLAGPSLMDKPCIPGTAMGAAPIAFLKK